MNVFFNVYIVYFLKAVCCVCTFHVCALCMYIHDCVCVCVCVCVFSQLPIPWALLLTLILLPGRIHFL